MDQFLNADKEKFTYVKLNNKKEDAIVNQEINSFITNNNLNPENIKIISLNDNGILNRFFTQELKISSESSYVMINDNKIINIQ